MFGFSLHFSRWGALITLLLSVASLLFAAPNLIPRATYDALPQWMKAPRMPLGLDLQGGTHLLYQIDTVQLKKDWLQAVQISARQTFSENKLVHSGIVIAGNQVRVTVKDPAKTDQALAALRKLAAPISDSVLNTQGALDLDVKRVSDNVITLEPSQGGLQNRISSSVSRAIEVLRRRIDPTGTTEAIIQAQGGTQGKDRILIQVPGLEPAEVKDRVGTTAKLSFQLVDQSMTPEDAQASGPPPDSMLLPDEEHAGRQVLVYKDVLVSGDDLERAYPGFDSSSRGTGEPTVEFVFKGRGRAAFAKVTTENIDKPFAIILDNKVISAPYIRSPITGGRGQITGNFTVEQANRLSLLLQSGALPAPLSIIEERSVGPSLGADSIEAGKLAGIVGFVAVSGLMIAAYGLFGVFSVIALIVNIAIILACLSLFHATLTLPGIAGIVLTMGVAVDANVLIYERIREEQSLGRSMISAIEAGFDRAYGTIIDSHLTGLLAALILYVLGSGTVRGFAVTLSFGIISSLFTAITVTRLMVSTWLREARPTALEI